MIKCHDLRDDSRPSEASAVFLVVCLYDVLPNSQVDGLHGNAADTSFQFNKHFPIEFSCPARPL